MISYKRLEIPRDGVKTLDQHFGTHAHLRGRKKSQGTRLARNSVTGAES